MTDTPTSPQDRSALVKDLARRLGFDLVGIAPAVPSAHPDAYRAWLAAGRHGTMDYLATQVDERLDIRKKFPWAQSVICLATSYYQDPPPPAADGEKGAPAGAAGGCGEMGSKTAAEDGEMRRPAAAAGRGKIARYAWGRDYHRLLAKKLTDFEKELRKALATPFEARTYTDTGPILEREFAARAGLGWIGKHTLVIHPRHGSWFLLAEMVTSLELSHDLPLTDHCGTCTRCIDACPTNAIVPHSVDASKCLSYHTLENRGDIPDDIAPAARAAGYLIGCDICQEVCPFNHNPLPTHELDFAPRPPAPSILLSDVLAWTEQDWDIQTRGRAHRRARHAMWQRTARLLAAPAAAAPPPLAAAAPPSGAAAPPGAGLP